MLTTFARLSNKCQPRNHLLPGVTIYYTHRRRTALTPSVTTVSTLPEIPASAPEFALQTLKFPVDSKQQEVLASTNRRVIVCCTRQWGKSSIGAVKALHHAATNRFVVAEITQFESKHTCLYSRAHRYIQLRKPFAERALTILCHDFANEQLQHRIETYHV